jgi:serine phosphatase RsbU (regulator of sigma subunit)
MFGEDGLAAAARRGTGSPAEVLGQVLDELATFSGGAAQVDDRTLILARAK